MAILNILSKTEWPQYKTDGTIEVMYSIMAQVDDDIPMHLMIPKMGYTDQLLRDAVKREIASRSRPGAPGAPRSMPL